MSPEQTELFERLRRLLEHESTLREVSMFGGRSVMVNEKVIVSALKDGGLLVRVDAKQHDDLLTRPGATQAVMGPGRDMGPGWIEVVPASLDDDDLAFWVNTALAYNRTSRS